MGLPGIALGQCFVQEPNHNPCSYQELGSKITRLAFQPSLPPSTCVPFLYFVFKRGCSVFQTRVEYSTPHSYAVLVASVSLNYSKPSVLQNQLLSDIKLLSSSLPLGCHSLLADAEGNSIQNFSSCPPYFQTLISSGTFTCSIYTAGVFLSCFTPGTVDSAANTQHPRG